ncbi:amidohydrolase [Pseudomonas sp. 148P]|uniref:Amidohydrolase n=1 Tax=Pseudomonas ulcerans TaxID=3115852 RepID=A0ABU7HS04_9PSED|nr:MULTISPECIES: amidohydrolase [unclassified Pseudomonas]MEE1922025.1 amidohydrolase [Pseudomonas sp. 147P]MEE1934315.1 amidohydrolase [Pseudomonas sp. 148P]
MSQRPQFGCACCTPNMLPRFENGPEAWQALLAEAESLTPHGGQQAVIFHGGHIYPDPERPGQKVAAIGIAQGEVKASGSLDDVRKAMQQYQPVDRPLAAGETLLPGLIDAHAHLMSSALIADWTDLSPIKKDQRLNTEYNLEKIKELIAGAAEKVKDQPLKQRWVTGFGVDPSLMAEWEDITASTLDDICAKVGPDIKVFLLNASGHISYANTAALKLAGLDEQFPDGVLTETQSAQMIPKLPQPGALQFFHNLKQIFTEANKRGITTVFDASVGLVGKQYEIGLMRLLAKTHVLTLRVGGALYGSNDADLKTWLSSYHPELDSKGDELFTLRAMKLIADGSNQGLTGLQSEPYKCCHEHQVPGVGAYGLFNYDPVRELANVMADVCAKGWPILTHANGDEAIDNVLSAYQLALCTVPTDKEQLPEPPFNSVPAWANQRHRIEHCSLLHDDAIALMKRMAISPSFLIGHVGYWGRAFQETILGEARANMLDRCASALKGGLRISLHSDRFVTPFGPLRYMEQSIGRVMEAVVDETHEDQRILNKHERLDVHQALRAVTIDAAWQCHLDHQVGSLLPGKQADLVILAQDPLQWTATDAAGMRDIQVQETWVSGRKVHSA